MLARPWMVGIAALLGAFAAAAQDLEQRIPIPAAKSPDVASIATPACNPEHFLRRFGSGVLEQPWVRAEWIGWMTHGRNLPSPIGGAAPGGDGDFRSGLRVSGGYGWAATSVSDFTGDGFFLATAVSVVAILILPARKSCGCAASINSLRGCRTPM